MNSLRTRFSGYIFAAPLPSVAFAEVSDKFASIPELLLQGLIASIMGFFLARWHSWLAVIGIAVGIVMFSGISLLWQDEHMGEALFAEQGVKYFIALVFSGLAVVASSILGAFVRLRRNRTSEI
jgi:hypothetical protein